SVFSLLPLLLFFFFTPPRPPRSPLFPYMTLFRSRRGARPHPSTDRAALGGHRSAHTARALPPARHGGRRDRRLRRAAAVARGTRSEEHTSELQSLRHLVCRLLLEKHVM